MPRIHTRRSDVVEPVVSEDGFADKVVEVVIVDRDRFRLALDEFEGSFAEDLLHLNPSKSIKINQNSFEYLNIMYNPVQGYYYIILGLIRLG